MKVQRNHSEAKKIIDVKFEGLATDFEDDLWVFSNGYAICFGSSDYSGTAENALDGYGPFEKFDGKLVIEND